MSQTQTRYQRHESPKSAGAETLDGLVMELAIESMPLAGLNRRIERTHGRDSALTNAHDTLMIRVDNLLDRMLEHIPSTPCLNPSPLEETQLITLVSAQGG